MGQKRLSRGNNAGDLHRPERRAWYRSVDDDRKGKAYCNRCGLEVFHVEIDGKWHVRCHDGLPHALVCEAE